MEPDKELEQIVQERMAQLPKVVQDAIRSADVTAHLRKLAETHKLHLDQWEALEEEVQYTLLGLQPSEELEQNIKSEVGVTDEVAHALTVDIAEIVFEPVRQALERTLEHPDAQAATVSAMENSRQQAIQSENASENVPAIPKQVVLPATPPSARPTGTAKRAPIDPTYLSSTPSHQRPTVEGDPYREQPDGK